jgi:hypothetical protein
MILGIMEAPMPTRDINPTPQTHQAKLAALRAALEAGEASGIAEGDVVNEVRERIRRRAMVSGAF